MGITHSTPADGTFSGTGSTAWNAEHNLTESGGQALTVGAISDGQFLKRNGTTITSATPSSDIVAADAPNQDFDLTNGGAGGAVTILSKSITGISAGDQIYLDLFLSILNDSGAARAYTYGTDLGSLAASYAISTQINASATSRYLLRIGALFSVSASNYTWTQASCLASNNIVAANTGIGANTLLSVHGWNESSGDLTGTQTLLFAVTSASTTGTQTGTLRAYTIRKIASNP